MECFWNWEKFDKVGVEKKRERVSLEWWVKVRICRVCEVLLRI